MCVRRRSYFRAVVPISPLPELPWGAVSSVLVMMRASTVTASSRRHSTFHRRKAPLRIGGTTGAGAAHPSREAAPSMALEARLAMTALKSESADCVSPLWSKARIQSCRECHDAAALLSSRPRDVASVKNRPHHRNGGGGGSQSMEYSRRIALLGADESGYSPIAGPVVAAACWMSLAAQRQAVLFLRDSKTMTSVDRSRAYDRLMRLPKSDFVFSVKQYPAEAFHEHASPFAIKQNALSMAIRDVRQQLSASSMSTAISDGQLPPREFSGRILSSAANYTVVRWPCPNDHPRGDAKTRDAVAFDIPWATFVVLVDGGNCVVPLDLIHENAVAQRALASVDLRSIEARRSNNEEDRRRRDSVFVASQTIHAYVEKGDSRSPTISAASVLAQHTFNLSMDKLHKLHPQYGFAAHKGYRTRAHLEALKQFGPLQGVHRWCNVDVRNAQQMREHCALQPSANGHSRAASPASKKRSATAMPMPYVASPAVPNATEQGPAASQVPAPPPAGMFTKDGSVTRKGQRELNRI